MVSQRSAFPLYRDVRRLEDWSPPSVVVLAGGEKFFKRDLVAFLAARLSGGTQAPDTLTEIDPCGVAELKAALFDLRTPSLFGSRRVVFARNAGKASSSSSDLLTTALKEGLPYGYLVLDIERPSARSAFLQEAKRRDAVVWCRKLYDTPPLWRKNAAPYQTELHAWVVEHAGRLGLKITLPVAGELIALTGNNPSLIDAELKKLYQRVGGTREVRPPDIAALVPDQRRDSIFHIVDATLLGNIREAQSALDRVLQLGYTSGNRTITDHASVAILSVGAFTQRLKLLRRALPLYRRDPTASALKASGLVPAPAVPVVEQQLRRCSLAVLAEACGCLRRADRALKGLSGRYDPAFVLTDLVLRLGKCFLSA